MNAKPRLPSQAVSPIHRRAKAAAIVAAFACVFSGAALTPMSAQAAGRAQQLIVFTDIGPNLELSSGKTTVQSDVGIDFFKRSVPSGEQETASYWSTATIGGDASPSASATWRIVEDGVESNFGIQIEMSSSHPCNFFEYEVGSTNPIPVSPDEVPYSCSFSVDRVGRDLHSNWGATLHLDSVVWSSIAGSVAAAGSVGLDQGRQESPNGHFLISDSLYKAGGPVADINPGEKTSWKADIRNGEGATATDGARSDFTYRIREAGEPTQYYVKGFLQNVKSASHFNRDYECDIYDGDPAHGGAVAETSPYACLFNATDSDYTHPRLAVDFMVKAFKPLGPVVTSLTSSVTSTGSVGLDSGHFASSSPRFWVNGSVFASDQTVTNINPGETTSWKAEMREGEDTGNRTDFSYRIVENGVPTEFYVKGFVQINKAGEYYEKTHGCAIYSHDPDAGGTVTESSPYECTSNVPEGEFFGPNDGHSDPHFDTHYNITTR